MNIFNRVVIVLLILVAMIVIPLALIFPEQAAFVLRYGADLIDVNLGWLNTLTPAGQIGVRILMGAVGLIVFLVGILFLMLEVVRIRRRTVQLRNGSGELMMEGVAGHLAYYIDMLPEVLTVKPDVRSRGKSVEVSLYVETSPDVSIPEKSAEIKETASHVIEEQLGLRISKEVQVLIKPVSHPRGRLAARPPRKQPTPPAPEPVKPVWPEAPEPEPAALEEWEEEAPAEAAAPEPAEESTEEPSTAAEGNETVEVKRRESAE